LPQKLQQQLTALVRDTGKTEAEIVREAIEDYCRRHDRQPTCLDLAEKAGLVGCVSEAPPDLSTGARHMEGFGRD